MKNRIVARFQDRVDNTDDCTGNNAGCEGNPGKDN